MTSMSFGGPWTIEKLEILRRYLDAYTTALKDQPFTLIYVDAFAGRGTWTPGRGYALDDYSDAAKIQEGSPLIALGIDNKPFDRILLIEKDASNVQSLWKIQEKFPARIIDVVYGDANEKLPDFCRTLDAMDRAVVFLDPYATQVNWHTVESIARTQKIDCWILFPLMAISHMMPKGNEPTEALAAQLDRIFGGREYWKGLYNRPTQMTLFNDMQGLERQHGSEGIALRYQERLRTVFEKVAISGRTLRNSKDSPMFELFFAASNPVGAPIAVDIANHILRNW